MLIIETTTLSYYHRQNPILKAKIKTHCYMLPRTLANTLILSKLFQRVEHGGHRRHTPSTKNAQENTKQFLKKMLR